jgi:four helix bundle protein
MGQNVLAKSAKDLRVYKQAYALAMEIFEISKGWPKEEKYALTDQVRRSSRAVCANLREAWSKRRYEAHFVSKLTDVDAENNETDTWLDFAKDCGYLDPEEHIDLANKCIEVGKLVGSMLNNAKSFVISN